MSTPSCRGRAAMPSAGKNSAEEWRMYAAGRLLCIDCKRFIKHTKRGKLYRHTGKRQARAGQEG